MDDPDSMGLAVRNGYARSSIIGGRDRVQNRQVADCEEVAKQGSVVGLADGCYRLSKPCGSGRAVEVGIVGVLELRRRHEYATTSTENGLVVAEHIVGKAHTRRGIVVGILTGKGLIIHVEANPAIHSQPGGHLTGILEIDAAIVRPIGYQTVVASRRPKFGQHAYLERF